jgi:3-methyladenine DNA glycosylase/8-oxoguanine DNA glycosylase
MELILTAHPPFSLSAVVESHGWARLVPFAWDKEDGVLAYVGQLDSGRVVEMRFREALDGVRVEVDHGLSADEEAQVTRQTTWMLDLERDLAPFYALAREEPKLAQVEARAQGRLLRSPTLFEDTVKTILTTNTAWSGTIRMAAAVVAQFGDPLPSDPARHAFPPPERLAASDEETLRTETRLGYRAPYVLGLARSVAAGDLDLEAFKASDLSAGQLYKQLLAIKGVGGYAAAHLLMLLGRYDFLPIDSWAKIAVSREWHSGEPVGAAEVEAAFARWGEWKGLAYWFWDWSPWDEA